jgi:DNA-directed RNA polymerase specialized sigma24 family protein
MSEANEDLCMREARLHLFLVEQRSTMVSHARRVIGGLDVVVSPEDVVQSASLSFYHYLRKRPDADLGDGLMVLARRCVETAANDLRKWSRPRRVPSADRGGPVADSGSGLGDGRPGPLTQAMDRERRDSRQNAVREAMDGLEPLDRMILQLRVEDEDHFTFTRIAELVGTTPDAARMRYKRAVDRMRPLLRTLLAGDSELGLRLE